MAGGQERVLRRRIKSVQSTKKITRAMELIAASRIKKAEERVRAAVPYSDAITRAARDLADAGGEASSPLLTARPDRVHHLTEAWLRRYGIRWNLLIMRPWGDYEVARDFKQSTVWELRSVGFELVLAFEDDRRNVAMFRSEGIPCLYVHSGYYD